MALSEKQIIKALKPIGDPDKRESIVDLGYVKAVKIGGGNIAITLELPSEFKPDMRPQLREACVNAVNDVKGVDHVSVNMTVQSATAGQVQQRRVLEGVKNIVAVASGKGGVAKSTTSTNLALALSDMGYSVGILDADIYGPSVPTMVAINKPPDQTPDKRIHPAEGHGIKIISMAFFVPPDQAAILRGPMVSGYVSQFLAQVHWGELDYLIIDYPPGTGDIQLTLSQQAPLTGAVITTTPQQIALADVQRAVSMFETTRVPVLGVCETMSYFQPEGETQKYYIFGRGGGAKMAYKLGVPLLGQIPIDPRVTETGDKGEPIVRAYPESDPARAYKELARAVDDQLKTMHEQQGEYLESFYLEWKV